MLDEVSLFQIIMVLRMIRTCVICVMGDSPKLGVIGWLCSVILALPGIPLHFFSDGIIVLDDVSVPANDSAVT